MFRKKRKIIIWGAGDHALIVLDLIQKNRDFEIAGFIDEINPSPRSLCGYPVLGGPEIFPSLYKKSIRYGFPAIGDNAVRRDKMKSLSEFGFEIPVLIHPFSSVGSGVTFGPGTIVCHGSVLDPGVTVGRGVILNAQSIVGHECVIGDFAHLSGGAKIGAKTQMGEESFIGIGVSVIPGIMIGRRVFVAAGSVVTKNIPDDCSAAGVPARVRREEAFS